MDGKAKVERRTRWYRCGLCEQEYHGVVHCALSWACWKTYVGRPESDWARTVAMTELGGGLLAAKQFADALPVHEAALAAMRRLGEAEDNILAVQSNLAVSYSQLGRFEEAMPLRRDVYSGRLKLHGEEHNQTLFAAYNYANMLVHLERFEEGKALLRRTLPVARRVLGENDDMTLRMRWTSATALHDDPNATLDDFREAVNTLEDTEQTARRVLGGAHPSTVKIERSLRMARVALAARGGDVASLREAVGAMTAGDYEWRESRSPPGARGDVESLREAVEAMTAGDA